MRSADAALCGGVAEASMSTKDRLLELARALDAGTCSNPFAVLGPHLLQPDASWVVRTFLPGASSAEVVSRSTGERIVGLERIGDSALFEGCTQGLDDGLRRDYLLAIERDGQRSLIEDPYRFGPWLGELDAWLLAEGRHLHPWRKLGAHKVSIDGIDGTVFAVWAPNAQRVSVVGPFNDWDGRRHPMRRRPECGVWEIFLPGVDVGELYKFELRDAEARLVLKSDPYARESEGPPGNASRVSAWPADERVPVREAPRGAGPVSIYEVHAGSWRCPDGRIPDWDALADSLIPYVVDLGFTHLELLPISEHPFHGSWGYQPTALYAPVARHGSPAALRRFVDAAHAAGLQVIVDWVPGHFPTDPHALARFDGTALYEHADPREGVHRDWDTLIYNFGRNEVRNYLVGNALYWVEQYRIDGLRVDAVASMLYRDYSRPHDEWIPNVQGGRENLEAIDFLRQTNETLHREAPGTLIVAEESTAFPGVTAPVGHGGLGFDLKWNMGWMHDTLAYFARDPAHRRWHHDEITFAMIYAYSERYVLPLSHDEVVHGKRSLLGKMWGDEWQKRANLRALYGLMYAFPGAKLLFMGAELATPHEWNHDAELDWGLLEDPAHAGVQTLVRDLNRIYRARPCLYELDGEPRGFQWIIVDDRDNSVFAFARFGHNAGEVLVAICNLTPMPRHAYRIGLPQGGEWRECLNTDSTHYGGSNVGNQGRVRAEATGSHGRNCSVELTLPPLAVIWLEPVLR